MSHTRWVGHLFTYVKTCERDCVKDVLNNGRKYITRFSPEDPDNRVIKESQCTNMITIKINIKHEQLPISQILRKLKYMYV